MRGSIRGHPGGKVLARARRQEPAAPRRAAARCGILCGCRTRSTGWTASCRASSPTCFVVLGLFLVAYLVSRLAGRAGGWLLARRSDDEPVALYRARQRETLTTLARTTVSYVAYGLALVLAIVAVSGARRIETVAGASFVAVILAFAVQRFLTDVLTGAVMLFEGWFSVGDTITVEPWKLEGRGRGGRASSHHHPLRHDPGEQLRVHNSQVLAVHGDPPRRARARRRAVPAPTRTQGRALLEGAPGVVPVGPLQLIRPPHLVAGRDKLGEGQLYRLPARRPQQPASGGWCGDFLPAACLSGGSPTD